MGFDDLTGVTDGENVEENLMGFELGFTDGLELGVNEG